MFALEIDTRHCLCCGICTDVCPPRAIAARPARAPGIEGCVTYDRLALPRNLERPAEVLDGYPYLAQPPRCDGCGICVDECPVTVISLLTTGEQNPRTSSHVAARWRAEVPHPPA